MSNVYKIDRLRIKGNGEFSQEILLGRVLDVSIDGNSILNLNRQADIPIASASYPGVIKVDGDHGITMNGKFIEINSASNNEVRMGTNTLKPITPFTQKDAAFYGLAKAAGDITQSSSSNAVGTYTNSAKTAIRNMLDVPSKAESFASFPATAADVGKSISPKTVANGKVTEWEFTNDKILIVHVTEQNGYYILDKTWNEINDVIQNGIVVGYFNDYPLLAGACLYDGYFYKVQFNFGDWNFLTEIADDYPQMSAQSG